MLRDAVGPAAFSLLLAALAWLVARRWVDRPLARRESGLRLAWFRIAYSSVLFLEVGQLARLEPLWSGETAWNAASDANLGYVVGAWQLAIVCLGLGLFTRSAALVSYVATLATLSTFQRFEYHADYVFTTVNLLLVALPVSTRLSLDRALAKLRCRRAGAAMPAPARVGEIHATLLVVFGVGVVYFDSVFYKLVSPMWTSGLGVWLPASLPHVAWNDMSPILDHEWLAKALGWLTLAFETLFLALVWWRPLRPLLLLVGLGLHLGITLVFPIPWFGLVVSSLYLLLVPPSWVEGASAWLARARPRVSIPGALAKRARGALEALLGEPAPGSPARCAEPPRLLLIGLVAFLLLSQAFATLQAPLLREAAERVGLAGGLRRIRPVAADWTEHVGRPLAGITKHAVFMDHHFQGYDEVISVASVDASGQETMLPYWDASGAPTRLNTGRLWVFWNWRVVGTTPDRASVAEGVRRLTAFWARERGLPLDGARFVVRSKRIEVPTHWASGWLRRERARPWTELGRAEWTQGRFRFELGELHAARQPAALPPLATNQDPFGSQ